ncbi:hypothetical protein EHS25_003814 [Saitozyma podzolica]|uniref:RING-type domain-containing protein n=1 Tax=Saitozyma podzolica TaxID=1890683 RepID=A0A427Y3L5_9TREE|nr:hypothetical protein EHS25_003814 [Saitozyma podzolica]
MGSSQSQPRPARSPLAESTTQEVQAAPPDRSSRATETMRSRFSSLRRLSSFGTRRGESEAKRGRPGSHVSSSSNGRDRKKPRLAVEDDSEMFETQTQTQTTTPMSSESSTSMSMGLGVDRGGEGQGWGEMTEAVAPMSSGSLELYPQPGSSGSPGSPGSPDPLRLERVRSIASIRRALGENWQPPNTTSTTSTPTPHAPSGPSPPSPRPQASRRQSLPTPTNQSSTGTLTALLGFSAPAPTASNVVPPAAQSNPGRSGGRPSDAEMGLSELEDLAAQLESVRSDLEQSHRDMEETRARVGQEQQRQQEQEQEQEQDPEGARGIPAGAVLVIQGLAQTTVTPTPTPGQDADSSSVQEGVDGTRRPGHSRRLSDGSLLRRRQEPQPPSLEAQARMIGGLLTVAAAATATTLLSPATPSPATQRSAAAAALGGLMNRLRPNRVQRTAQSIEQALGTYLRNVLRDNRQLEASESVNLPTSDDGPAPPVTGEFQRFLEVLQMDLVAAVRDFATPVVDEEEEPEDETLPDTPAVQQQLGEDRPIPTFHRQRGQNLPGAASQRSTGVTGGHDGLPRRLNFFRAHLFPPTDESDEHAVVPCIFIGARSIAHAPGLTTEQLVQHPSFPFVDGQVPTPSTDSAPEEPPTPEPQAPRRSFRERVMDRLNARRNPLPPTPLNTYLVYVIGGNYPRDHPVLRIPNLITGGPLSDEEMALVAELMGPAKPPTATSEEIEKSGLKIVDGGDMAELAEKHEVLDSCVERCLICLSEYETGEECRVLNCRHAFHKDCVDQWLSKGSNSCPACRTEAVNKAAQVSPQDVPLPSDSSMDVDLEERSEPIHPGPSGTTHDA